MEAKEIIDQVVESIQEKKGHNISILDLTKLSAMADYFIICSGDATIQVKAIADEVDKKLRKQGVKSSNKEGYNSLNWVLLDYFDVVVHVFKKDAREFYNLEKLWGDAEITYIEDEN